MPGAAPAKRMMSTWRLFGVLLILTTGFGAALHLAGRPDLFPLWPLLVSLVACGLAAAIWWRWRSMALPFLFALGAVALFPWAVDWHSDQIPRPLNLIPALACLALFLLAGGWSFVPQDADFREDAERSRPPVIGKPGADWRARFLPEPRPPLWKILGSTLLWFVMGLLLIAPANYIVISLITGLWPGFPDMALRLPQYAGGALVTAPGIILWILFSLFGARLLRWSGAVWIMAAALSATMVGLSIFVNPLVLPLALLPLVLAPHFERLLSSRFWMP
jgi:hypothetical protein